MNILFIGAHPDDLEILCGGTIRLCVEQGHEVWMAVATNGNVGTPTLTREEIGAIRKKEATQASEILGAAGLIWLDEDDEWLFNDRRMRVKFIDAIRQSNADVIVTHNPNDYHPDHLATSSGITDARIPASVRLVETTFPHLKHVPELFYMDSVAGIGFSPQWYVDITSVYDKKMEALRCHDSQNAWVKEIFDHDLTGIAQIQMAFRGIQSGVRYAEAFSQPDYWPKKAIGLPFMNH